MLICNCQEKVFYRSSRFVARGVELVVYATMLVVVFATISGCAAPAQRAQRLAQQQGLAPVLLQGKRFKHHGFAAIRGERDLLVLFIEGDGSPWLAGGRRIAADPTPRVPLALGLAAATPGSILYLGRPCYLESVMPPECSPDLWTAKRYSEEVVASMSAAARAFVTEHHFERVLLVGYSGGGTLAALMARDLPGVVGLVTVAGNLDPDAWAQLHGYLPLQGSLNPALERPLPASLPQWYLVGQRDTNVPPAATARYMARVAPERVWSYPSFDHACCWVAEWPAVFARVSAELTSAEWAPMSEPK
jgi:dienelactone hydrolase